ncbi:hypothetical protein FHX37_1889 [Haloactinospora alba]|uniref:Trypsin-co-occurring domain-containing protein n=1 Tax=Haloactinospora alba TaxID=405555 RepID=A0A543NJI8_9ACTN|nr:CU044_2847 family protein [Haloactinospora alba]TQN31964.1 hypothetical protein FHX37_1889 [Haloactinospora alba]
MTEIIRFTSTRGDPILVEATGTSSVMREVSGTAGFRNSEHAFETILGKVRDMSDLVAGELTRLSSGPDEVTVELGVNVSAEADVFIARASGESSITVTMTWRNDGSGGWEA